ncbi:hypothetical protein K3G63_02070 [Hymenobacter sp. HSC-4F20]|nr:hypothetical protein [Hymenobacter sp. HSC-4F20]
MEHAESLIRYRVLIKKYCNNCGSTIDYTAPELKERINKINIKCPACSALQELQPRNEQYQIQYKSTSKVNDPIFSLPLWLQTEVKGNLLWAYNRRHLQDIKEYVESKLRERQTTRYTTMVERLPTFIKVAKNRSAILKVVERLINK